MKILMEKDSNINATQKTGVMESAISKELVKRILFALIGLFLLGGSIELLQKIAWVYSTWASPGGNFYDFVFVTHWLPQFAILFFALGWFTTHWVETALLKNQIKTVKILILVLLLGGVILGTCFRFFVDYEILNHFGFTILQLILSGTFLRYSVFSNKAFDMQRKILYEKNKTSE